MYKIIRREAFSDENFLWEVQAPDIAASARPGQFVMVRLHEGSERIPLTVADFDREHGGVTMVIQALGKTTREMRDVYGAGDSFNDIVGPLGQAQHVSKVGRVLLVGGGLGVAPGGNIGTDGAVFEPIHGSAPSHAGKNEANPVAMILSGALMLRHLGEQAAGEKVENAVAAVIADGSRVTYDLRPDRDPAKAAGTTGMAEAIIEAMG